MHNGQHGIENSRLRPFVCVGVAYFVIAVIVPVILLTTNGEQGGWTISGIVYSLAAGTLGAVGAFGIILALSNADRPSTSCRGVRRAPVVNTFVTMMMSHTYRKANWLFFACVGLVALGAAGVLVAEPARENIQISENSDGSIEVEKRTDSAKSSQEWRADSLHELQTNVELAEANKLYIAKKRLSVPEPRGGDLFRIANRNVLGIVRNPSCTKVKREWPAVVFAPFCASGSRISLWRSCSRCSCWQPGQNPERGFRIAIPRDSCGPSVPVPLERSGRSASSWLSTLAVVPSS